MSPFRTWRRLREDWGILTYYQRFESSVAFVLTLIIPLIILVALFRLIVGVIEGLLLDVFDPWTTSYFKRCSARS